MQFNPLYSSLNPKLFHIQQPSPLRGAKAGHFNLALAKELQWTDEEKQAWVEICSGQRTFSEFPPLAMVYAGHQFGQWAGQLGDGRGLLIAQILNKRPNHRFTFKGAALRPIRAWEMGEQFTLCYS